MYDKWQIPIYEWNFSDANNTGVLIVYITVRFCIILEKTPLKLSQCKNLWHFKNNTYLGFHFVIFFVKQFSLPFDIFTFIIMYKKLHTLHVKRVV